MPVTTGPNSRWVNSARAQLNEVKHIRERVNREPMAPHHRQMWHSATEIIRRDADQRLEFYRQAEKDYPDLRLTE